MMQANLQQPAIKSTLPANICIQYPSALAGMAGMHVRRRAVMGEIWGGAYNEVNLRSGRDYAFPTQQELAFRLGCSVGTIRRDIAFLKNLGLLEVERAGRRGNRYRPVWQKFEGGLATPMFSVRYPQVLDAVEGLTFEQKVLFATLHGLGQNRKGIAYPSIRYLAKEHGLGRKKVMRILDQLVAWGLLVAVTQKGRVSNYYGGPLWTEINLNRSKGDRSIDQKGIGRQPLIDQKGIRICLGGSESVDLSVQRACVGGQEVALEKERLAYRPHPRSDTPPPKAKPTRPTVADSEKADTILNKIRALRAECEQATADFYAQKEVQNEYKWRKAGLYRG